MTLFTLLLVSEVSLRPEILKMFDIEVLEFFEYLAWKKLRKGLVFVIEILKQP